MKKRRQRTALREELGDLLRRHVEWQVPNKHDQPTLLRLAVGRFSVCCCRGGGAGLRGFLPASTFGCCSQCEVLFPFLSLLFIAFPGLSCVLRLALRLSYPAVTPLPLRRPRLFLNLCLVVRSVRQGSWSRGRLLALGSGAESERFLLLLGELLVGGHLGELRRALEWWEGEVRRCRERGGGRRTKCAGALVSNFSRQSRRSAWAKKRLLVRTLRAFPEHQLGAKKVRKDPIKPADPKRANIVRVYADKSTRASRDGYSSDAVNETTTTRRQHPPQPPKKLDHAPINISLTRCRRARPKLEHRLELGRPVIDHLVREGHPFPVGRGVRGNLAVPEGDGDTWVGGSDEAAVPAFLASAREGEGRRGDGRRTGR